MKWLETVSVCLVLYYEMYERVHSMSTDSVTVSKLCGVLILYLARGNTCTQPILAGFPRWFCVEVKLLLESAEALGALDVEPQGKTTLKTKI